MEFTFAIVGTKFRPKSAQEIAHNLRPGDEVQLVPEPENPYDENAIKVLAEGEHIGYVRAATAKLMIDYFENEDAVSADVESSMPDLIAYVNFG